MDTLVQKLPKAFQSDALNPAKLNRTLPPVVTILFIIACSYTLAQITWSLIPGDDAQAVAPRNFNASRQTSRTKTPDYSHISNAHLFGEFKQTRAVASKIDAPETRLNLVLKGVLATTPMKNASAIISLGKNGKEDTYSVGDKVSSATLREVYADRVILERGGRLETLRMPKDTSKNLIQSVRNNRNSTGTASRANTPGAVLSDIRQQIMKNPTSFGKFAIPVPYMEKGRLRGYRLQPQGDRTLFDKVGLQTNDVIIALNGIKLNNPSSGLKALRKLQRAKSIDLTVLRNGAELPLHFEMP